MRKITSFSGLLIILCLGFNACNPKPDTKKDSADSFSFVFMTDIHLQPERSAPLGLMQAIDSVNMLHPDFVLTGGDLIMDALGAREERADSLYQLYVSVMKKLTVPVYNTVGNHENLGWENPKLVKPENPLFGRGMFKKYLGEPYYTFEHKGWKFFVLCSAQQTSEGYTGAIDTTQMNWIKQELANTDSGMPLAISIHIPLVSVYNQMEEASTSPMQAGLITSNGKDVLDLFIHHNLRLVLQGHLHYLESIRVRNITFITGGAVSSAWWGGRNKGLEEGFLYLKLAGNDVQWRYVDYGWEPKP
jgi:3',5'-cyclic-AMP phosphodiesterase